MTAQAHGRRADVLQVLARLREERGADPLVDDLVAVTADHQIVGRRLGEQVAVVRGAHVRDEHQQVAVAGQRLVAPRRAQRIGESQPREAVGMARGASLALEIGHHAHESDPHPVLLHDDTGRRLRHGRRVAPQVGAHHGKLRESEHVAQHGVSGIEFVVAQRGRVVAQAVHQFEHRPAILRQIDVGVARPAVARIDQEDHVGGIAAGLHRRGELREALDAGVDVVRREQHHGALPGPAGGRRGQQQTAQAMAEDFFLHEVQNIFATAKVMNKIVIFTRH